MEVVKRSIEFKITRTTTEDMPVYEHPSSVEAEAVRTLPAGSDVRWGDWDWRFTETIDGVTYNWSYVITPEGTIGWIFTDLFNDIIEEDWAAMQVPQSGQDAGENL